VTPLTDLREEIEARVGGSGGFIRLNPRVDDLAERVAVTRGGISLIVAGAISRGGAGCACPQSVLLRSLLDHVVLETDEAVVVDLEAGLEHLGRRSAQAADALLVVVDPTRAGIDTAERIRRLAAEIGVGQVLAVADRVRNESDVAFLSAGLGEVELVGVIPYSARIEEAERSGKAVPASDDVTRAAIERLVDELVARFGAPVATGAGAPAAARAGR
jgi:CO dehydrogenase maturation factor